MATHELVLDLAVLLDCANEHLIITFEVVILRDHPAGTIDEIDVEGGPTEHNVEGIRQWQHGNEQCLRLANDCLTFNGHSVLSG